MDPINLLGVDFADITLAAAVTRLLARDAEAPLAYVVTPNADHLARLRRQPEFLVLYQTAWLCLLDSQLVFRLASWLGLRPPPVVTGADLTKTLLGALPGGQVAVIGLKTPEFLRLRAAYPHIAFMHHSPPMGLRAGSPDFIAAQKFGRTAAARFTFVALGAPLQETLAHAMRANGATGIALCIGAALEFLTGRARAPAWMRRAGLEWFYRLAQDPRRLARRYLLDDPPILLALLQEALRRRKA